MQKYADWEGNETRKHPSIIIRCTWLSSCDWSLTLIFGDVNICWTDVANDEKCKGFFTWKGNYAKNSTVYLWSSLTGSRQNKSKSGYWIMRQQFYLLLPTVPKKAQSAILTQFHSFTYRVQSQYKMLTGYLRDYWKRLCDKNNTDYVTRYPWIQDSLTLVRMSMERFIFFHLK